MTIGAFRVLSFTFFSISFDFSDFSFWVLILQTVRCIAAINCQTAWQHTPYLKYLFFLVRRFMSLSVFMHTYYLSFCLPMNVSLSLLIFNTFLFALFLVSHSRSRCDVWQFFLQQLFWFSSTIEERVVFRLCFRTCHWSK